MLGETSNINITCRCCGRLQHPHFSQIYRYGIYFYNFKGNKNDHAQNEHTDKILRNIDVFGRRVEYAEFFFSIETPTNELYA